MIIRTAFAINQTTITTNRLDGHLPTIRRWMLYKMRPVQMLNECRLGLDRMCLSNVLVKTLGSFPRFAFSIPVFGTNLPVPANLTQQFDHRSCYLLTNSCPAFSDLCYPALQNSLVYLFHLGPANVGN